MSINTIPEDNNQLIEDNVSVEKIDKQEKQTNVEDEKLRRRELLERKREETRRKKEEEVKDNNNNNNDNKKQRETSKQNDADDTDNVEREDEQAEKKEIKAKPKIREDQVQNAISFLNNPRVKPTALGRKVAFLERQGLTSEEIKEALRRTSGNSKTNSNTNTNTNYNTNNNDNEEEENNSPPPRSTSHTNTNPNTNRARRTQLNNPNSSQNFNSNSNNYGRNELEPRGGFASTKGNKGEREREYRYTNNYRESEMYDNRQHHIAAQEQPLTWKNVAMTGATLVGIGGGLAWLTKNYVLPLIPRFKHTSTPSTPEKDSVSPRPNATPTESSNIAELREQINALSKTVVSQNESLTQALRLLNANGKSEGLSEIAELRKEIQSLKGSSNQTNESSPKTEKGEPSNEIIELKQQLATLSNKLTQVSRLSAAQNTTYTPPPITTPNPYVMSWSPQSSGGTAVIPAWQQKGSNTSTSPQQSSTLPHQSTANDSTTSVSLQTTSNTTTTTSTIQQVPSSSTLPPQNGNSEPVSTDHPYSQSFVDIMNLVAEGKNPPGIKDIDDKPLDNEAPVNKGSKQPPLKPWEKKLSPKVNAFQGLSVPYQVPFVSFPPREKTVRFNVEDTFTSTTTTTSTTPSSPRIEEIIEPTEKKKEEETVV